MRTLTKREEHIKTIFLPNQRSEKKTYLDEEEVHGIIDAISELGRAIGFVGINPTKCKQKEEKRKHKYDVWIAKEIKKDIDILNETLKFRLIIDWAIETKCSLFDYDFSSALTEQEIWHTDLMKQLEIEPIKIPEIDQDRIIYRCGDKSFFIYLLNSADLPSEGKRMMSCVGGKHYQTKAKKEECIYVSLRDGKNNPHITTEIDMRSKKIIQLLGKTNQNPKAEYMEKILEFILFYTNYETLENKQQIKFLNLNNLF